MTINHIIKESLERLRKEHLSLTPDNYTQIFCKVAKEKGVATEDCQKVQKFLSRLDMELQNESKRYKISSVDDLLGFLIAKLNMINPTDSARMITGLNSMSKKILQGVNLIPHRKAKALSSASYERLESASNLKSVELIRDKWSEFVDGFDDSYIKKLSALGITNKDDIDLILSEISNSFTSKQDDQNSSLRSIIPLIIATLTPSIATSMSDEISSISYELRATPDMLYDTHMQQKVKKFIQKRVELDKKEIKRNIIILDELLNEVNKKIIFFVQNNLNSKVKGIKAELESLDFTHNSFEAVQAKLMSIASSLDFEIDSFNQKMQENREQIATLQATIKKLEVELSHANQISKEDFLTSVYTKRALMSELEAIEQGFGNHNIDYSVCFVDLDHFKNVNDQFGHEAGDVILKTVGKILKKYASQLDVVGRYGGEEFLIVLPKKNKAQATEFAQKIRAEIENFKFIYKNERINVTASFGVCERSGCEDKQTMINLADKMLYKAKESGRNQVIS